MPLFRIETRPKHEDAAAERKTERRAEGAQRVRPGRREAERSGGISAVALGLMVGVALLLGVTLALLGSQFLGRGAGDGAGGAPSAGAPGANAPAGVALAQPLNPGPINGDYPRDYTVAVVNGQPMTMRELETAVRVARTLGKLTGDPVPNFGDQDMLGYQVKILKREVDLRLLRQAQLSSGVVAPTGPVDDLILGFLQQVGATEQQLGQQMAENSVTRQQLDAWFDASRATNAFVVEKLLVDRDISERDAVVQAWIDQQWDQQQVVIDFYDPEQVLPQAPAAPAPGDSAPAPAGGEGAAP